SRIVQNLVRVGGGVGLGEVVILHRDDEHVPDLLGGGGQHCGGTGAEGEHRGFGIRTLFVFWFHSLIAHRFKLASRDSAKEWLFGLRAGLCARTSSTLEILRDDGERVSNR